MPTLQEQINALPAGGTLNAPGEFIEKIVINKPITLVGAKIVSPDADPAVFIPPKTRGVTLRGCEITGSAATIFDIVRIGEWQTSVLADVPDSILLDQCDIHGHATQEVQRGIAANGSNISILNSKVREIHGKGYDTQAVGAWNGPGPFKFLDSYFEASGENIMFGGATPSITNLIPSNIEIRRCQFFKPLAWKGVWTVKNLFELKNAKNVLIDSCTFENCWVDAQIGYAILFTVRSEDGRAPWATIENVTFTNNTVKNSEQGFQLLGSDAPSPSGRGSGLLIRNNQFTGIKNRFITMSGFYNVVFEHNTHEQGGNIASLYGEKSNGLIWRNNATLRVPETYGVKGDSAEEGKATLDMYASGYVFEGNVIAGALERLYPAGNFFPADLSSLSSFKGTDGLVPGYMGAVIAQPSPTPSPVPSPTPPTLATRVVAWPGTEGKQNEVLSQQWAERYRMKRNLSGPKAEFEFVP